MCAYDFTPDDFMFGSDCLYDGYQMKGAYEITHVCVLVFIATSGDRCGLYSTFYVVGSFNDYSISTPLVFI